jgi:hypothetical protein
LLDLLRIMEAPLQPHLASVTRLQDLH